MNEIIEIKLGGYQPPSSVHNRGAEIFGEELEDRLGAAVAFTLDGNMIESHGIKAIDLLALVEGGDLTMCYFASSYLVQRVPELAIFDLPFVVRKRDEAYAALDGALGDLICQGFLENTGYRVLGFWDNGFRHFTNGVRAIRTPADCQGLSIRTMNNEVHQETFRRLGFEPTFVDVKDLVEAAKSGSIDAQENPLTNTYNFGTYRYHRHITLSGHFFGVGLLLVNRAIHDAWPANVQEAVAAAAARATVAQRQFAAAEDDEILAKLDPAESDVVRLDDGERAAFAAAVEPLIAEYREKLGNDIFAYFS